MGHAAPRVDWNPNRPPPQRPAPDRMATTGGWPTAPIVVAVGFLVFRLAAMATLVVGFGTRRSTLGGVALALLLASFPAEAFADSRARRDSRARPRRDPYDEAVAAYLAEDDVFALARFDHKLNRIMGLDVERERTAVARAARGDPVAD